MSIIIDKVTYKTQTADNGMVLVNGDNRVKSIDLPINAEHWDEEIDILKWQEPDWSIRIDVSNEIMEIFANDYPEYLVALNYPPKNPKYKYNN